ncbi:MAG TPA: GHKL domain-containing protein [Saprospiraceae bacterium]|nr:GHKL domain-containing protein [Saprospiraceae bacterium]
MKNSFYILVVLFLLSLGAGIYLNFSNTPDLVLKKYTKTIQKQLNKDYLSVKKNLEDPEFFNLAFYPDSTTNNNKFDHLYNQPYTLLAYEDGQLVKWFNNKLFLPDSIFRSLDHNGFHKTSNAYTYIVKKEYTSDDHKKRVGIGIIPIKYAYQIDKLKPSNLFRADPNIPAKIKVRQVESPNVIRGPSSGKTYLSPEPDFVDTPTQKWLILFFGLAFFFFLSIANQIGNKLSQTNPTRGTMFLLAILTIITVLLNFFDPAVKLNGLGALADTLQLKVLNVSLAVVLFNAVTFVWLMVYLNKTYVFRQDNNLKYWQKIGISVGLNIALMTGIIVVLAIYKQIIISSDVNISFLALLEHKMDSLLGLTVVIISLTALVLFALWMIKFISKLNLNRYERALCIALAFFLVLITLVVFNLPYRNSILYGTAILLPFALDFYISDRPRREPYEIYIWFGLTSLFAAVAIYYFQNTREYEEMEKYAQTLSEERDTTAEKEIIDQLHQIVIDPSWDSVYAPRPYFYKYDKAQLLLINHLQQSKYLSNNFSHNFYLFNDDGPSFLDQSFTESEYRNKIANALQIHPYKNLYLLNTSNGGFSYFVEQKIRIKDFEETLVIELKSEILGTENINSPIFSSSSDYVKLKEIGDYDYATFKGDVCIRKKGNIQNKYYSLEEIPPPGEGVKSKNGPYINYVYHSPNGNVVLMRKKAGGVMQFLSLFSMLFFLISILAIIINLINKLIRFIPEGLQIKLLPGHSFYAKVQSGFLILMYISFIAIGIVTAIHFNNSNKQYHDKRLLRKSGAIHTNLYYTLLNYPTTTPIDSLQDVVEAAIYPLSVIHKMDAINFFGLNGQLIYSSKNEVYLKGVVPPEMDASAFVYLSQNRASQQIKNEDIGNVQFKSSYFPVKHSGDVIGYLGIPYYTKEQARLNAFNDFVSRLLIAYIALFIIALGFIVIGSRFLAAPIKRLSNAIRRNKNEPIIWEDDDEFKDFVNVYNESLKEKEMHHQLVIKMEKESAWRDMARQVAHDIKNPLTPIQLHIQHFQRSIRDRKMDMDQVEKRTDRVTEIILTQINSLLRKVANFQDVANIAEGARENILINKILTDIAMLHENETNVDVFVQLPEESVYVNGNKGQIERVFSNLVKNAVQAIPDDHQGVIVLSLTLEQNYAIVSIKDNGVGIPEHMTDKVFTPNFTTKNSGTGLGLHICKSIVESHNGDIMFTTNRGEGTIFTVRLKTSRIMSNLNDTVSERV